MKGFFPESTKESIMSPKNTMSSGIAKPWPQAQMVPITINATSSFVAYRN